MTNKLKALTVFLLSLVIAFSFAGCSGGEDSKELRSTVESAQNALVDFNTEKIDKFVDSETLLSIESLVNSKSQYQQLAKAIFANLQIKVKKVSVNDEKGTGKVTLKIRNKDLATVTDDYVSSKVSEYLAGKVDFNNEEYLNKQLDYLTEQIDKADETKWQKVTVNVKKTKDGNWMLIFDDAAENAVMGGAASKLKSMVKLTGSTNAQSNSTNSDN